MTAGGTFSLHLALHLENDFGLLRFYQKCDLSCSPISSEVVGPNETFLLHSVFFTSGVFVCSITPPKAPVFEEPQATDAPQATEEKGMSIPVIGSSECSILLPVGQVTGFSFLLAQFISHY